MRINKNKLEKMYNEKGLNLKELLAKAGISKTAYYNLIYKDRLLPRSVYSIARILGIPPSDFIEEASCEEKSIADLLKLTDEIINENPDLDRDNVRHTLLLLKEEPVARLKRGLRRGTKFNFY